MSMNFSPASIASLTLDESCACLEPGIAIIYYETTSKKGRSLPSPRLSGPAPPTHSKKMATTDSEKPVLVERKWLESPSKEKPTFNFKLLQFNTLADGR